MTVIKRWLPYTVTTIHRFDCRKAIAATVRIITYSEQAIAGSSYSFNAHVEYNCDLVRFLIP